MRLILLGGFSIERKYGKTVVFGHGHTGEMSYAFLYDLYHIFNNTNTITTELCSVYVSPNLFLKRHLSV